jgi:peptidoglycan hydrolase-like protein with peptidoglycan-binding domain
MESLVFRARVLGLPATVKAVLADLTWPARALVPHQPATSTVATLRRLPAVAAEARRAPATLAKVALASSMTISILAGSAAAAIHVGSEVADGGPVRVSLPGHGSALVWTARPIAADKGAAGHSAVASGATGRSPGSGTLPPATASGPTGPAVVPTVRAGLPPGKGMWLYQPEKVEGGNVGAIVAKATATGLNYLYLHLGSSTDGFIDPAFLDRLLPAAHAAHIRVYGWDFPYFTPPEADVSRAVAEINHRAPSGDRIDGFASDVEPEPGVNLSPATAGTYASELRSAVGPGYPLIGVVPRPNGSGYPYSAVLSHSDAVAVMDYWLNREPGADIAGANANLAGQNVAMIPIGQAYNGAENGVPGSPSGAAISRFVQVAEQTGAVGVSFWSWQDTTPDEWGAIRNAPQFSLPTFPAPMSSGQIRTWQALLSSLGFPVWTTGVWDQGSVAAVSNYQRAAHLPITGVVDDATKNVMMTPFPPPIQPAQPPPPPPSPSPPPPPPPAPAAPSAPPPASPPPVTTTTVLPSPNPLLPFLSGSQGMGTPTSAPQSH